MKIRNLTESDVTFTLIAEYEDTPVRGNVMVSGDDAADRECEDEIIRRLESGDVWAWAWVRVTATWKGFRGSDSLGCCSYRDEKDFREGGYFEDMKKEALADLQRNVVESWQQIESLVE